jgi:hypothetical protein
MLYSRASSKPSSQWVIWLLACNPTAICNQRNLFSLSHDIIWIMSDARDYQKELDRLMAPVEEKADRLADRAAEQYIPDLLKRARNAGLSMPAVAKMLEDGRDFGEIEETIRKRSTQH